VWGASWQGSAPAEPPSGRLPAESIPTSAPHGDLSLVLQEQAADEWMVRLADPADDDLPLILVDDGPGLVDARLRVTPDRTDVPELLHSFVDHMTRWRDDVSDEEAENFYDLGTSFLGMEQWESAVKVFDQAMRSPATRVAAAEGYLQALMGMGDHHAAFGAAGMALGNPAAAGEPLSGILFLRGRAAEGIGDPREARRCYREALRINRFYADARERLAALGE
jgi:tetratricopeptide (TPR) repeat protein